MSVPIASNAPEPSERRSAVLAALLALAVTLAVFLPVAHFGYVDWDDTIHICDNPYLNPVTFPHVLHFWQKPYHNLFVPLSYTVYALLALLARLPAPIVGPRGEPVFYNPHVFHLANLILHLVNVLLVYLLLRRVVKNPWAACGGTLLFALHPAQVESVAWISELRGLLGNGLSLTALWLYLRFALLSPAPENRVTRRWLYAAALGVFVLALLAKPSAVVTPVLAALLDAVVARRAARVILRSLLGWGIVAGAVVLLTRDVQAVPSFLVVPLWQRPFVAGDALAFYIGQTLLPWRFGIDYGRSPLFVLDHAWGYVTWLLPAAVGGLLWVGRRRFPMLPFATGLFAVVLLPVLGFFPFIYQNYSTVADRYLYLAMLGPALALAWALSRARGPVSPALCAVVLLALALRSGTQVSYWRDNETLFRHAVAVYPGSAAMHNLLGLALEERGETSEALAHFARATRLRPNFTPAEVNYGDELLACGQSKAAMAEYRLILRQTPGEPGAEAGLGEALALQDHDSEAAPCLRAALQATPNNAKAHHALALAFADAGHTAEAVAQWRQEAALTPGDPGVHYNLAVGLMKLGDRAGAQAEWQAAQRLEPGLKLASVPPPSR